MKKDDDYQQLILKALLEMEETRKDKMHRQRADAIILHAYLDDLLKDVLKARLIKNNKLFNTYLGEKGSLTFARRLDLCYLLGLINVYTRRALRKINDIRNIFAHHKEVIDFHTEKVKKECMSLYTTFLNDPTVKSIGLKEKFNDPRKIYEQTCHVYQALLVIIVRYGKRLELNEHMK